MMTRYKSFNETNKDGLGDPSIPSGYNQPGFGVADAKAGTPAPDQTLAAASAGETTNGIDPLNKGFQVGGAQDPFTEFDLLKVKTPTPPPTPPMNSPSFGTTSMTEDEAAIENDLFSEDGIGMTPEGIPVGVSEDELSFESIDQMPEFDEDFDDLEIASLPVDANGIIEPETFGDSVPFEPELGEIPDVVLPNEEPIVVVEDDEPDVYASENELDDEDGPEPVIVQESFKLPEDKSVGICKGDQIFCIGHALNEKRPKFAESAFKRAFRSLLESKGQKGRIAVKKSEGLKKCVMVGRSLLVEVAKDWRIPGTPHILEAHDIIQIVSAQPITEGRLTEKGNIDNFGDKKAPLFKKEDGGKKDEDETMEEKKLRREAELAHRRWAEARARNLGEACKKPKKEDEDEDTKLQKDTDEGKDAKDDKKKEESRRKTEAYLRNNGIYF